MPELVSSRRWAHDGTALFRAALDRVDDERLAGAAALPGWTGRHLVAHVAANADALLNLVHWARTGAPTPMYSSPSQRDADIETGAAQPSDELRSRVAVSADALDAALDELTPEQWSRQVRTAQGRTVPATEIPWMRARETMVHAVDLGGGLDLDDLPDDFLAALVDDVVGKRSSAGGPALDVVAGGRTWSLPGAGAPVEVRGSLAAVAAYLTGRAASGPAPTSSSGVVPDLPPWL